MHFLSLIATYLTNLSFSRLRITLNFFSLHAPFRGTHIPTSMATTHYICWDYFHRIMVQNEPSWRVLILCLLIIWSFWLRWYLSLLFHKKKKKKKNIIWSLVGITNYWLNPWKMRAYISLISIPGGCLNNPLSRDCSLHYSYFICLNVSWAGHTWLENFNF